ncbi:MAG: hypothetical protein ABW175_17660, partial [Bradyrhizobium sp.]
MSRAVRSLAILFALLGGAVPARAADDAALERGAAITDPAALRELDGSKFRLDSLLFPGRTTDAPLANSELFATSPMLSMRQAIDGEFDRYVVRHHASLPTETIGVGAGFDFQMFDRALLYSPDTRFVLAGIVNRMDRTYVAEANCGEIRLIYRLTRINRAAGDEAAPPRLPMTLNLVVKAKGEAATLTCAEIARRWLALPAGGTGTASNGPLDLIGHDGIDRIEINLQIAHAPKSAVREFRTDYLLKVFRYDR